MTTQVALADVEAKICEIWGRVLNLQTVAPTDNFFLLGGDSLGAIETVLAIADVYRLAPADVSVSDVFDAASAAHYASLIHKLIMDTSTNHR